MLGNVPFLPSGNIISSDINSGVNGNGRLLVYERGFTQACYLEGYVTDGNSGLSLTDVDVEILNTIMPQITSTNLNGFYDCGNADSGTFDVVFSKLGYISDTLQAILINGQIVILNAILYIDPNVPILGVWIQLLVILILTLIPLLSMVEKLIILFLVEDTIIHILEVNI